MMVAKRSEYQNQFKSSVVRKHHDIYMANLALRHERRDREFMHTPLCWTEESVEDENINSENSDEDVQPVTSVSEIKKKAESEVREVYQSLAEIMSEAKEKADRLRRQRLERQSNPAEAYKKVVENSEIHDDINKSAEEKEIADKSLSIYDIVDKENRKLNQKIAQAYVFEEKESEFGEVSDIKEKEIEGREKGISELTKESNLRKTYVKRQAVKKSSTPHPDKSKSKTSVHKRSSKAKGSTGSAISGPVPSLSLTSLLSQRPVRPDRLSKRRPMSACSQSKHPKPPFMAYGAADVEDSLALHRTHNVLAPRDVYPMALKAKSRREEEQRRSKEKKLSAKHSLSAEDLLERLGSVGLTPRDDWASEYSQQFHGYEPREYQRAISARSVLPRAASTSFMPVRSGGCRVVHVD